MIVIILIIIVFGGMAVFLLALADNVSQSEYINLYTHNLLSSMLRTDTGITNPSCKTVSDLLACSFLSPTYICEAGRTCFSMAETVIDRIVSDFASDKQGFRYLLIVEPEGFVALPQGIPYTVEIGDLTLKDARIEKITSNERIQRVLGGNPYLMDIRLTISRKGI